MVLKCTTSDQGKACSRQALDKPPQATPEHTKITSTIIKTSATSNRMHYVICPFLICEGELDSWNHVVVSQGQLFHSTSLSGIQDILHNKGAFQPSNNNHPALISSVDSKLMDMLMVTMNKLMVGPR
jgi:hypothetical protein